MSAIQPGTYALCHRDELSNGKTLEFRLGEGDWPLRLFVIQRDDKLYAYRNLCPHAGMALNWKPDEFLTNDQSLIMCRAHGALFEIESGECIAGPCTGRALRAYPVSTNTKGHVVVEVDAEAVAQSR